MVLYYTWLMHPCIFYYDVGRGITPSIPHKYSKVSLGRGLVKISAIFSLVLTYSNLISFSTTFYLNMWYLIEMCLVFICNTRILCIFTMHVLSQSMTKVSLISIIISFNICFIQTNWLQFFVAATYFASTILCEVQSYFFLSQETNLSPRKKAPPLFLFFSSTLPAQSTLV